MKTLAILGLFMASSSYLLAQSLGFGCYLKGQAGWEENVLNSISSIPFEYRHIQNNTGNNFTLSDVPAIMYPHGLLAGTLAMGPNFLATLKDYSIINLSLAAQLKFKQKIIGKPALVSESFTLQGVTQPYYYAVDPPTLRPIWGFFAELEFFSNYNVIHDDLYLSSIFGFTAEEIEVYLTNGRGNMKVIASQETLKKIMNYWQHNFYFGLGLGNRPKNFSMTSYQVNNWKGLYLLLGITDIVKVYKSVPLEYSPNDNFPWFIAVGLKWCFIFKYKNTR